MILNENTLTRLLGSIEANRLVLLCGAGLSMPPPSELMSAVRVSRACYDKYHPIKALPAEMRDDIDQLAGHFLATGEFESVFIGSLVPWNDLVGQPNHGHAAVADFLICGAADAVLSANFDTLIEQWALDRKIAMRGHSMARKPWNSPIMQAPSSSFMDASYVTGRKRSGRKPSLPNQELLTGSLSVLIG